MARVAEAETGHAAEAQAHADLPKHAFGSCSICTRRLLSASQQTSAGTGAPHPRAALPTRFLVQTSPVVDRVDGGR
ncbi:MAG TPA: hypothetical protein VFO49_00470 [Nocardioides sp.]|nr:hypothetical protein [Nocardioides sp.]